MMANQIRLNFGYFRFLASRFSRVKKLRRAYIAKNNWVSRLTKTSSEIRWFETGILNFNTYVMFS